MEHGELAGEAEDQVERHGQDPVDEREDEDRQHEVAAHRQRQRGEQHEHGGPELHSLPTRPDGRKRRIATRTARPEASRRGVGRKMEPTASMLPTMTTTITPNTTSFIFGSPTSPRRIAPGST